jgi:hypothetical protein
MADVIADPSHRSATATLKELLELSATYRRKLEAMKLKLKVPPASEKK